MAKPTGVILAEAQGNAIANHQGTRTNGTGGAASANQAQSNAALNGQALVP
jgi:hypothetical protein